MLVALLVPPVIVVTVLLISYAADGWMNWQSSLDPVHESACEGRVQVSICCQRSVDLFRYSETSVDERGRNHDQRPARNRQRAVDPHHRELPPARSRASCVRRSS